MAFKKRIFSITEIEIISFYKNINVKTKVGAKDAARFGNDEPMSLIDHASICKGKLHVVHKKNATFGKDPGHECISQDTISLLKGEFKSSPKIKVLFGMLCEGDKFYKQSVKFQDLVKKYGNEDILKKLMKILCRAKLVSVKRRSFETSFKNIHNATVFVFEKKQRFKETLKLIESHSKNEFSQGGG